jgi:hypothetical protein
MADEIERPTTLSQLEEKWQVEERPFQSGTAVMGGAIRWLRERWNNVSTKWYVRAILQQQNEFNRLTVQHLQEIQGQMEDVNGRLVAQDRDQSDLAHDVGELTAQLVQTNRLLQSIDDRLSRLEME